MIRQAFRACACCRASRQGCSIAFDIVRTSVSLDCHRLRHVAGRYDSAIASVLLASRPRRGRGYVGVEKKEGNKHLSCRRRRSAIAAAPMLRQSFSALAHCSLSAWISLGADRRIGSAIRPRVRVSCSFHSRLASHAAASLRPLSDSHTHTLASVAGGLTIPLKWKLVACTEYATAAVFIESSIARAPNHLMAQRTSREWHSVASARRSSCSASHKSMQRLSRPGTRRRCVRFLQLPLSGARSFEDVAWEGESTHGGRKSSPHMSTDPVRRPPCSPSIV